MPGTIIVGILTYNDVDYTVASLDSVVNNIDPAFKDRTRVVVVDDGTPDGNKVEQLRSVCANKGAQFIAHGTNRGASAGLKTICEYDPTAEMICYLQNDNRITSVDWLPCAWYFMDKNPSVGASTFPLVYVYPNGSRGIWFDKTKLPAITRQFQATLILKGDVYRRTRGPEEHLMDGYSGVSLSFEIYRAGYEIIQMPYPSFEHWGGDSGGSGNYTFSNNHSLREEHKRQMEQWGGFVKIWAERWPEYENKDWPGDYQIIAKHLVYPQMKYQRTIHWLDEGRQEKRCLVPKEMPCRYDPIDGELPEHLFREDRGIKEL